MMTFEQWMTRVDNLVWQQAGYSIHDLPDCLFRDWHEDRLTPDEAAARAIEES